jgi:tetratricopeptide (TPR) repeat protein
VIDADDRIHGELHLPDLTHDAYDLRYGPDFVYWRRQIFRTGLGWHFRGVLHEYPSCDRATDSSRIDGSYHIESGRSGARNRVPDKYRRDAAVLERALRNEPGNERYWFYLGQSLFDAGDPRAARSAYARRVELGGWDEETFYALFRIAVCDEALVEPEERVIASFLRAHEARPSRAEPLHALANSCRRRERWELGYLLAEQAAAIPFPERDQLFVHADVYRFRALDELATCAFYAGRLPAGRAACQELLGRDLPEADRERISRNLLLYEGRSA